VESASLPPLGGRVAPAGLDSPAVRTAIVAARHLLLRRKQTPRKLVLSPCEITTCGRAVGAPGSSCHFRVRPWMTRIYLRDHQEITPAFCTSAVAGSGE
jgi:hypothetical protein